MDKAIFLDRDGTINEDVGWLYKPKNLVFLNGSVDALMNLQVVFSLYYYKSGWNRGRRIFK